MKKAIWLLMFMVLVLTACQRTPAPTAAPAATAAEAVEPAAPTEAPPTESAAALVSHAFETGSASLEIEVPLDGRLAEPIEIETEHGVRFSAEAGTVLRTLRGMFVTGPITIGIDDADGFGAPPDDIEVDGVVRVYLLVQTASGPELLNVRFEPAGQLQLPQAEADTGIWVTYSPLAGSRRLQGPLPEAAAATSGVLAAPANSDVRQQSPDYFTVPGIETSNRMRWGYSRIVHIAAAVLGEVENYSIPTPTIDIDGSGGYYQHHKILDLLNSDYQAENLGFDPGPNGQFTSAFRIHNFTGPANEITKIFPEGWQVQLGDQLGYPMIHVTLPDHSPAFISTSDSNLQFWDVDTLEKLWEMPLGYQTTKNPILSSSEKSVFLATDDGKILSVRTESEDDELSAFVRGDARPPSFDECLEGVESVDGIKLKCDIIEVDGLLNIALDPIGEGLLATTKKGEVIAIDPDTLEQKLLAADFLVDNSIIAPNGGYVLGAMGNQIVQLNLVTRRVRTTVSVRDAHNVILGGISYSGDRVAAAYTGGKYGDGSEGAYGIVDLTSGKIIQAFATAGEASYLGWTPDDKYLVVADWIANLVSIVDTRTFEEEHTSALGPHNLMIIAEDVEGEALATLVYTGGNSIHRVDITEAGELVNLTQVSTAAWPSSFSITISLMYTTCGSGTYPVPFDFSIADDNIITMVSKELGTLRGLFNPVTGGIDVSGAKGSMNGTIYVNDGGGIGIKGTAKSEDIGGCQPTYNISG